jgi:SLAP domain-containing protein
MGSQKQTVQEAKDLLTLCLARAIDEALTAKKGPFWFSQFLADDQAQEPAFRIARNNQNSVRDFDLQALLKILRYRENYAQIVLVHYDFLNFNDPYDTHTKQRQIRALLDRLITDFRNQIEAHSRVADIERSRSRQDDSRLYGYQEALNDMAKLSGIFAVVRDDAGHSYHKQLQRLAEKPRRSRRMRLFTILCGSAAVVAAGIFLAFTLLNTTPTYTPKAPTTGNVYYNPAEPKRINNQVSVQPVHVYYENGTVVAQCYIHNGMGRTVKNMKVDQLILSDSKGRICAASFGALQDATLRRNSALLWTFVFNGDTVLRTDGDLSGLQTEYILTCN